MIGTELTVGGNIVVNHSNYLFPHDKETVPEESYGKNDASAVGIANIV